MMRLCSKRFKPLHKVLLEGPALLPPQVGKIEFPTHLARSPVTVQAPGEGVEGDNTPVRSFNVRRLR
eukprot:2966485-Amphidinium_carterae.1